MFSISLTSYQISVMVAILSVSLLAKPIKIGMSADLSGPHKTIGTSLVSGIKPTISKINKKGGINGQRVRFIVLDDKSNPNQTYKNTQRLIKRYKVDLLFSYTGVDGVKEALPLMIKSNTPLFFPYSNASHLHVGDYSPLTFHWRPSDLEEATALMNYLARNKRRKIAIYYAKTNIGVSGFNSIKKALRKKRLTPVIAIGVKPSSDLTNNFELDTFLLLKENPTAIICITPPNITAQIIKSIRTNTQTPIALMSSTDANKLTRELIKTNTTMTNIIMSQAVPTKKHNKNYKYFRKTVGKPYDPIIYEGYLNTIRLTQLLKRNSLEELIHNHGEVSQSLNDRHDVSLVRLTKKGWTSIQ
tara:strand:+ start:2593 stop:3666 length:1074 start_codon:yes stop_codon:yes gene_type:complete